MKRSSLPTRRSKAQARERGAAAVEFALVAPILLALVGGIIEFSYTYNLQISVTQAAREAARTMAIFNDQGRAQAAAVAGAPGLNAAGFTYTFTGTCPAGGTGNAQVAVGYTANTMTGIFGRSVTVRGTGAMRCHG
ncbi:pilus assembly protein [Arthrobacter sp. KBS0702]|uniref:TadE/TadG family type IV pilus assembly protein n=1 Tax=Arthrobacter sp. KBS0702 TaxID=2578107 RepID=UPI00110D2BFB|nr:TadE/TadG family type IV pilus assembly protein [Arthrobacter sp. KBS0702]QDW30518.1 pilus assembly protein [Arthrobacter sp. KBS0702]